MLHRSTRPGAFHTVAVTGLSALTVLAAAGCGDDRVVVDARHTLGAQLGSVPHGARSTPAGRDAASADDLAAARRYLEATLRLDPNNDGARAALFGLGGLAPDDGLATTALAALPGPLALGAPAGRRSSFTEAAFGEVGVLGADVAQAVTPWAVVPVIRLPITREASDSVPHIVAPARARLRTVSHRRETPAAAAPAVASRPDSTTFHIGIVASGPVAAPQKHKRTWPWTRAQRWLVAKGVGGGAGAGVIVGALIGNVPGALIAGSLGGGALGFKKATKIGPAAPYPSPRDSASFVADKRGHDVEGRKAHADTVTRSTASTGT